MKPYVRGKNIFLREVAVDDADFIVELRTNPVISKHISATSADVEMQKNYISEYASSPTDFYFVICDWDWRRLGTVRIYDVRGDSFCWGSWILSRNLPIASAALESALLIYDFGFFALHYLKSHFDVRKANERVVEFHKRFGAIIVAEDELNYFFQYDSVVYMNTRNKYRRYLP